MVASGMGEENNLGGDPQPGQTDPTTGPLEGDDEHAAEAAGTDAAAAKGALTPGQRLAAKKAQKATKKKEFKADLKRKEEEERDKEREEANRIFVRNRKAEGLPEEVQKAAGTFTHFMQDNKGRILGAIAAFVVASALFVLGQRYLFTGDTEQAKKLSAALEVAAAQVDATDEDGKSDTGEVVYKSRAERAQKAAEAYEAAIKLDPGSKAAAWASLALAELKLELGKHDEALKLYEQAYTSQKTDTPALAARALEGLAIANEAAGKADEAVKRYEELKAFDNGAQKDLAEYHLGRLKLAKGDKDGAKAILKPLYDRLNERAEGMPQSRYLKGEVEIRLAEIDSTLVDKGAGAGEGQYSQEEIQRLIEQLRMQQGAGGGAP
jgi:tetratricopeptide (TPR) repeat protein